MNAPRRNYRFDKVHAVGELMGAGWRRTACKSYMATGPITVASSRDAADVTCRSCLKAMVNA